MLSEKYIKDDTTFRPQLTSLVDVMTILLVFLLKSFSAEGQLITPSKDLSLPVSSSKNMPKPSVMIEISKNGIIYSDEIISGLNIDDSILSANIYNYGKNNFNAKDLKKKILLQIDSKIEFKVARIAMNSLNRLGAKNFSILVVQED